MELQQKVMESPSAILVGSRDELMVTLGLTADTALIVPNSNHNIMNLFNLNTRLQIVDSARKDIKTRSSMARSPVATNETRRLLYSPAAVRVMKDLPLSFSLSAKEADQTG